MDLNETEADDDHHSHFFLTIHQQRVLVGCAAVIIVRLTQVGAIVCLAEARHDQGGAGNFCPLRQSVVHT